MALPFETSKPNPPPMRPQLQILPKQSTNWETNIQIYQLVEAVLIQTPTAINSAVIMLLTYEHKNVGYFISINEVP